MSITPSVGQILKEHVSLEVEGLDRMYLNVYVPRLQWEQGVVAFFQRHLGQPVASSALVAPRTRGFVEALERFVKARSIPVVQFHKGERKDGVMADHLQHFAASEGVVFVGKAQEKTPVFRTEKRRKPETGCRYPWIVKSTALVNHYHYYCLDRDFGPFFVKFCSHFPQCQALSERPRVREAPTAKGKDRLPSPGQWHPLLCGSPTPASSLRWALGSEDRSLAGKMAAALASALNPSDREPGYGYDLSILQAEFSLTQVLARPAEGRIFFEQVIRENLDLGRPDQVQLIFGRRVTRATPGRFRRRVITSSVTPSLHVDYKTSRIKQYHKEGRAPRTATTINNPRDFSCGKRLCNLPRLRQIGFHANRRLIEVQRHSHEGRLGEEAFRQINRPREVKGQRASALRFTDARVLVLWTALVSFRLLARGFAHRDFARAGSRAHRANARDHHPPAG